VSLKLLIEVSSQASNFGLFKLFFAYLCDISQLYLLLNLLSLRWFRPGLAVFSVIKQEAPLEAS
jgi:hypothetical protein